VNDQETEKSALCSKVGASSQMGAKRKKKIYLNKNAPMSNIDVATELQKKMESILANALMNDFRQLVWLTTFRPDEEKSVHKCDKRKMCIMTDYLSNSMELSHS
jgi:hypothetical protein